ncbi:hypothetical protein [Acutalibacter caecimuris]|uniref:hypothetical protein n=1 Tax=Acutalibacter caecimuris TaxID=3093657 RepID=UPI002AC9CB44|nr:hypothetical protein [Acutalibacter sp. M00118]
MAKRFPLPSVEALLPVLLRWLAWLHCGLAAGMLFALVYGLLPLIISVPLSPAQAFWRGVLFAVPSALCYHAIKRQRALWQFLLTSLVLCALCWPLAGHPGGTVFMGLMCLFRLRARLAEEDEGPVQSLFDSPALPMLGLFGAAWLCSAILGLPALQKVSLLGGVLYLLACLCHHSLARVDAYLRLNRGISGLPTRRIWRIAGWTSLSGVLLAGLLLLPVALGDPGATRITLPEQRRDAAYTPYTPAEQPAAPPAAGMDMDLSKLVDGPTWQIPEWFSYLLFGLAGAIGLVALAAAVRGLFRNFRRSYTDSRDLIQSLDRSDRDRSEPLAAELARPRLWDRSHAATVRRRYRRAILRATKDRPDPCHTPAQLESAAGLQDPALHEAYEQVRYGG